MNEEEYRKLAEEVLKICQEYETECILHHYIYSAVRLHADGIHMSVPVAMRYNKITKAARLAGEIKSVEISTHSLEHIYLADSSAMDRFCVLGALDAVRLTSTKASDWSVAEAREAMEKGTLLYAGKYSMPDYELLLAEGCYAISWHCNLYRYVETFMEKINRKVWPNYES